MKIAIIAIATCILFIPVGALSRPGSRLDNVKCGKKMSRLDAEKCAEIRRMKAKARRMRSSSKRSGSHMEWDAQGRHYTPAGGVNLIRDDGTFMQKAAGGYINTDTGEFVPGK